MRVAVVGHGDRPVLGCFWLAKAVYGRVGACHHGLLVFSLRPSVGFAFYMLG